MARERDDKGRFVKGNKAGISTEVAREYQQRAVDSRAERKSLREALLTELCRKAKAGEPMTKLERLAAKAIDAHLEGPLTFRDLNALADLLGEKKITITHRAPLVITEAEAEAIDKWSRR